jgi:predicted ArsR family transcriptional regulator
MSELTEEQKREYFRRSYTAVDGLWFMKVEEQLGFEAALQIDEAVWRVLPKIQARALKGMMGLKGGLADLKQALSARLALEGFQFEMERQEDGLLVKVRSCPWHEIMIRSGRGSLSERVSDVICRVENATWASEFSDAGEIGFEREARMCRGEERCRLRFGKKSQGAEAGRD